MRVQQLSELTGPDGLRLTDATDPELSGDRVVIEVRAAGVSFPELLATYGRYQIRQPLPFVPGVEVSGVVRWAPPGASVRPGDRVAAATMVGGFAELATADPAMTVVLPESFDFDQGAAYVMNYQTALFCLGRRARVQPGEVVLVQGAAGGVGTASLQVAAGLGARAIGVVSTEDKRAFLRDRIPGADVVLADEGWPAQVGELTGGRGVDVVLDPVGGDRFTDNLRVLAPEGRVVVVGFTGGDIPVVKVNRLLLSNTGVLGAGWGEFARHDPGLPAVLDGQLRELAALGVVAPVVGTRFGLDAAADALRSLEQRAALGKVVLTVP